MQVNLSPARTRGDYRRSHDQQYKQDPERTGCHRQVACPEREYGIS
jgi:hypothetical protein